MLSFLFLIFIRDKQALAAKYYHLGCCYMCGKEGKCQNRRNGGTCWLKAAKLGSREAMYAYAHGHSPLVCNKIYTHFFCEAIQNDIDTAIYWYEKAAERQHPLAMFELGEIYQFCLLDKAKAKEWYKKSYHFGCNNLKAKIKRNISQFG